MRSKAHWESVYSAKPADQVSWYQPHAERSLRLIQELGIPKSASIIDVGGGASTLVDDLLNTDYEHLTVLDLSREAIRLAKKRLGSGAEKVIWREADILEERLPLHFYDLWHDRAVFHFLTNAGDRRRYVQQVTESVKPGGALIVATFAEDGPAQCSGLPVQRYSKEQLESEFEEAFSLVSNERETHQTPAGKQQEFIYCCFRKIV